MITFTHKIGLTIIAIIGLAGVCEIMYYRVAPAGPPPGQSSSTAEAPSSANSGQDAERHDSAEAAGLSLLSPAASPARDVDWCAMYRALQAVETGGRDGGEKGPLQITEICLADCNRIVGEQRWTLADRRDPRKAMAMMQTYLEHCGQDRDIETLARIWRNGPTGWNEPWTKDYGERVVNLYQLYGNE